MVRAGCDPEMIDTMKRVLFIARVDALTLGRRMHIHRQVIDWILEHELVR